MMKTNRARDPSGDKTLLPSFRSILPPRINRADKQKSGISNEASDDEWSVIAVMIMMMLMAIHAAIIVHLGVRDPLPLDGREAAMTR